MIKFFLTVLVASALGVVSLEAKTLQVPSEDSPIASIEIPDSWEPEEIADGVAGTSDDNAVYLAVVAVENEKGMNAEIEDTFEMLKEHNVGLP